MLLDQGSTCLPDYASFASLSFFIPLSEWKSVACLHAFPSRCPVLPIPGSDPRQTVDALQQHE